MIKFSKNIIRSFSDLPNKTSMIIHSIGCNLKCYQCFNYEALVHNPKDVCDETYILDQIKLNGFLVDAIILSGGEFLLNDLNKIKCFLKQIKSNFNGIIVINTNGTFPNKIKLLSEINLVDGFHTDIKLPYHLINIKKDKKLILNVIGKKIYQNDLNNILTSIKYTIKYNKGYSQFRSIKYPFLNESAFEENKKYIDLLNNKYNKLIPYYINEFVKGEDNCHQEKI